MKLCLVLLLYSIADFIGMLWTGYHSLVTIASFWVALALCYAWASWLQRKRTRAYRHVVRRAMREERR